MNNNLHPLNFTTKDLIFKFFTVLICFFFIACSKDETNTPDNDTVIMIQDKVHFDTSNHAGDITTFTVNDIFDPGVKVSDVEIYSEAEGTFKVKVLNVTQNSVTFISPGYYRNYLKMKYKNRKYALGNCMSIENQSSLYSISYETYTKNVSFKKSTRYYIGDDQQNIDYSLPKSDYEFSNLCYLNNTDELVVEVLSVNTNDIFLLFANFNTQNVRKEVVNNRYIIFRGNNSKLYGITNSGLYSLPSETLVCNKQTFELWDVCYNNIQNKAVAIGWISDNQFGIIEYDMNTMSTQQIALDIDKNELIDRIVYDAINDKYYGTSSINPNRSSLYEINNEYSTIKRIKLFNDSQEAINLAIDMDANLIYSLLQNISYPEDKMQMLSVFDQNKESNESIEIYDDNIKDILFY